MKITHLIAESVLQVFEGNNWTDVNIAETLKDIRVNEAYTITNASPNTIASLTHHLLYWNNVVMQRMNGIAPVIPEANGYNVPLIDNEMDWQQLIEATHQSFKAIANAVAAFPEERLMEISPEGKSTYYKTLQGIVEHAHYHLGQIVIIKHLVKANKLS